MIQVIDGNTGEHICHEEFFRVKYIWQIAVYQADVVGIDYIAGCIFNIPQEKCQSQKRQKVKNYPVCTVNYFFIPVSGKFHVISSCV